MKKTLLFLTAISFLACTDAKQETSTAYAPTPTGLEGIQKPVANASGELLNPVHGAPGHDCSIPVGALLKKAVIADTLEKSVSEAKNQATETPKQRLNPAHGMPGHDCAIPVGAPLT